MDTLVNVVSQIPPQVWERELTLKSRYCFVHSEEPLQADIHVIYGLRRRLVVPNNPEQIIFIASEPPEIRHYNLKVLGLYGAVAGPKFAYLAGLPRFAPLNAVAPWWVGTSAGGENHYENVGSPAKISRTDLEAGFFPAIEKVSTIVSNKARTPLQQQRLRLVDYLLRHLSSFEAFGLEHARVEDKSEVLGTYRYHLAIENSSHQAYWTEKLADPVLMNNYVFYFGDPLVGNRFDSSSIQTVNPWDPESTYALLSEALEKSAWELSSRARESNRHKLLRELSFHRTIEPILDGVRLAKKSDRITKFPPQHPASKGKAFLDPLYRLAKRLRLQKSRKTRN